MQCAVCGDKAFGCNFGAISCESCKSFYRRHAHKHVEFHCPSEGACTINKLTRKYCPACRLKKCFSVGMTKPLKDEICKVDIVKTELTTTQKCISSSKSATLNNLDDLNPHSESNSDNVATSSQDHDTDHIPVKMRFKRKVEEAAEASSCEPSSTTETCDVKRPLAPTALGSVNALSKEEYEEMKMQIEEVRQFSSAKYTPEELGRRDSPGPATVTRAVLCYMEMGLRRNVRGVKRLRDFSTLSQATQVLTMRRNIMELFQFHSMLTVCDDNTGWVVYGADGHLHLNYYERFMNFGKQFGMDFSLFVQRYAEMVAAIRNAFPKDNLFMITLFGIISCFSTGLELGNVASTGFEVTRVRAIKDRYMRFLEKYLQIEHASSSEKKLAFCHTIFEQVREVTELNTILTAQLLTGMPAPPPPNQSSPEATPESEEAQQQKFGPVNAAATIAPLLAETVLRSFEESS